MACGEGQAFQAFALFAQRFLGLRPPAYGRTSDLGCHRAGPCGPADLEIPLDGFKPRQAPWQPGRARSCASGDRESPQVTRRKPKPRQGRAVAAWGRARSCASGDREPPQVTRKENPSPDRGAVELGQSEVVARAATEAAPGNAKKKTQAPTGRRGSRAERGKRERRPRAAPGNAKRKPKPRGRAVAAWGRARSSRERRPRAAPGNAKRKPKHRQGRVRVGMAPLGIFRYHRHQFLGNGFDLFAADR